MPNLPAIALSIRQPWVWAILHAGKDIENRDWETLRRGPICLHAAKGMTQDEYNGFIRTIHYVSLSRPFPAGATVPQGRDLARGGIVGTADLVDCVRKHDSPWFFGKFGFVLANVQPVDFVPCKGKLGFFEWKREEVLL